MVEPVYAWDELDAPETKLWSSPGSINGERADLDIATRWMERPPVHVTATNTIAKVTPLSEPSITLEDGADITGFLEDTSPITVAINGVTVGDPDGAARVVFHVTNFVDMRNGPSVHWRDLNPGAPEILVARGDRWTLRLAHRPSDQQPPDRFVVVTHVGEVCRTDGSLMSTGDVLESLSTVQDLLSFARSGRSAPALPVALDGSGQALWREAAGRLVTPGSRRWSWLPASRPDMFVRLAEAWLSERSDFWQGVISRASSHLVESVKQPEHDPHLLDTRIVLVTAGLELFAWALLREDPPDDSLEWSEGGGAAANIRQLLRWVGMSSDVPEALPALEALRVAKGFEDAAAVAVGVRNAVVHPRRRDGRLSPPTDALREAWQLLCQLLEWCVLRSVGYDGEHGSRLRMGRWDGDVTPVAWNASDRGQAG